MLRKLACSGIGFPLVGQRRSVAPSVVFCPGKTPRQPPCFSLIFNLVLDRHPLMKLSDALSVKH